MSLHFIILFLNRFISLLIIKYNRQDSPHFSIDYFQYLVIWGKLFCMILLHNDPSQMAEVFSIVFFRISRVNLV